MIYQWLSPAQTTQPQNNDTGLPEPEHPTSLDHVHPTSGCAGFQVGTGAILYQQQKLVAQVNEQLNLPAELQPLFDQTLDNLTHWLRLLPAHPQHHCEPAGAVRHALETALWPVTALQQIHLDHGVDPAQRRAREPLWRLMTGVVGLLYDFGRIISCLVVRKPSEKNTEQCWPAFHHPLGSWLQQYRISHYSPHWQHSDNNPEKPLPLDYTAINLLLLPHLAPQAFRDTLKPDGDNGVLWHSFVTGLTGQKFGHGIPQIASAVEQARLKNVKLHFVTGEALNQMNKPASKGDQTERSEELKWLRQVITVLPPNEIKWAKDSLLLTWPDAVEQEELPEPDIVLQKWDQMGWIRPVGNKAVVNRNGRQVIALQPVISQRCKQWLPDEAVTGAGDDQ